jgi:hypothetical protein
MVTPSKDGRLSNDEVLVAFRRVDREGRLAGEEMSLVALGLNNRRIVGMNQNQRLVMLEQHVKKQEVVSLSVSSIPTVEGNTETHRP